MDKVDDLECALDNNYDIILQEYGIEAKEVALERAEDDHGERSNEYKLAKEELEDVELDLQDVKRTQELKFQQVYETVKDKQKALDLEEKKLAQEKTKAEFAEKKYDLGMISKVEYDDAKSDYDLQAIKLETAKSDLFTAYRKYEWMLKGLSL
jgi:Outer membrane protein